MDMVQTFKIVNGIDIGIDIDIAKISLLKQWTGVPEVRQDLTTWSSLDQSTSTAPLQAHQADRRPRMMSGRRKDKRGHVI